MKRVREKMLKLYAYIHTVICERFLTKFCFIFQLVAQILKLDNKYAGEKSMQV